MRYNCYAPKSSTQMSAPQCPSCSSDRSQTIKLMCLSATKSLSATSAGISASGDVGLAATTGRSTTQLAAQYAPGPKPDPSGPAVAVLLGGITGGCFSFLLFGGMSGSEVVGAVAGIGIFALIAHLARKWHTEKCAEWERRIPLYERGWICMQCGHAWLPEGAGTQNRNVAAI
jgi:hypothetical protein